MTTSIKEIDNYQQASVEAKIRTIVNTLCYVGEQCIIEARDGGTYTDRTGNLRSSIGYTVVHNGSVVQSGYNGKIKEGNEGVSEGLKYLQKKSQEAQKRYGTTLIVTAGMNYAEYVEAKGYVVLSGAQLIAPKLVKELLTQLGFIIK